MGSLAVFMVLTIISVPFHHYRKNPELPDNDPMDGVPLILSRAIMLCWALGASGGFLAVIMWAVAVIMGVR
jgi:hypothetical protein